MTAERTREPFPGSRAVYEITVTGHLDRRVWSHWFDGMQITHTADGATVLCGPVADQAALHGLLDKIRDLGLALISLRRSEPGR
jgi:hypothetical protein